MQYLYLLFVCLMSRTTNISRKNITLRDALDFSFFFSIWYETENFGIRPQRFPKRNIFSLKKQDKRSTFNEYQLRTISNFISNRTFKFINSSSIHSWNSRGRQRLVKFFTDGFTKLKIVFPKRSSKRDSILCYVKFFCFKRVTFSRKNYHRIAMQIDAKVHLTFKTRELCRAKVNKLRGITEFRIRHTKNRIFPALQLSFSSGTIFVFLFTQ